MTDQRPDPGDNNLSADNEPTPPQPEEAETAAEQPSEDEAPADAGAAEEAAETADEEAASTEEGQSAEPDAEAAADADEAAADVVAETEAEAADAAAAGAAWTTTPVAPDPEATEAALAALAAKPEVTLEPPETPPPPPHGEEEPDEGTPVLLVGGILVGAFIVALAIVLILFRPFDNLTDVDASLSPSPVVTEEPSESPSAIATVDTPDFVSMPLEEAEATATDYGLVVRVNPVETDEADPGTVLDQDPPPGEPVEEGSTIELSVAQPVPTGTVPDIIGVTEEDAILELEDAGFTIGDISYEFDDEVLVGGVISTDPPVDSELPQGSTIDLVVSEGPEFVAVPDLVDLTEAQALDALDTAGLAAGAMTEAASDTIVAGNVISSDPAADSEVAPGTEVAYVVSTGPALVAVPDLVDLTEAQALDALDTAGLAAGAMTEAASDTIVAGNVISSDPAADSEVAPGTEVAYVVSTGPALVAVPDLVDLTEAQALDALDTAGLAAGAMTEAASDTIVAGNVISSDPAADSEVAPGTEVAYVVSTGPALVAVPDLVDLTEAQALDALDTAGLAAGAMTEAASDTIVAGNVISSDPAADSEVAPGTEVAYVVSTGPALVAVPDLVDLTEAQALDALDTAGLAAGAMTEAASDTIVAGNVISSDPAADSEVAPGTEVAYVVSTGPALVAVPDLVDLTEAQALDALDTAGLAAGAMTEAASDTIVAGNVISSDPAADSEVAPGTEVAYVVSTGPALVAVPDLVDLTEAQALDALDTAGLAAGAMTEDHSDAVAPGDVISQNPAAGESVDIGSAVDYVVSLGVETVAVPDLTGAAADATDAITAAGLTVGDATQEYSDTVAAGDVISQDPTAGTEVELGTAVSYVESLGVEQVEVPDLTGAATDAEQKLTDAGLAAGAMTQDHSDAVAPGDVISQNPAAGESVDIGSAVDYVVSLGVETVAVPDLTGAAADATDAITAAGLTVGEATQEYSDTVAAGDVISQDPTAGTEVELGTAVSYVESLGVEQVEVPDLTGAAADAEQKLTDAGLAAGAMTQDHSDAVAPGDVISQNPAAGESVDIGSAVDYVVSLGVETVAVPDLTGAAADATDAITAAGLTVGEATQEYSDTVAAGDVISQDPTAGTEVELGTAVSYVESLGVEQVEVPDLTGAAADAEQKLTDAGLAAGAMTEDHSDAVAPGDVISQNPAAGESVDIGSAVDYVVSLGVETVAVPDLTGAAADATDAITAAGLTVGEATQEYSDTVAAGDVISQDPTAGTEVELGTAVSYVESLGVEQVEVPDLTGAAADAEQKLTDAGLAAGAMTQDHSDAVAPGDVISQNPAAGESVDIGSAVDYVVSLGVETVAVPDLTGAAADATDAITAAGLSVGAAIQEYSDTVAAGDVISQDPTAGTEVELGTAVSYVESLGVEQVEVPDLTGAAADAEQKLTDAGLAAGAMTQDHSDAVAPGDVISQNPAAGESVDIGSAVDYVVSLGVETVAVPDLTGAAADATDAITAAGLSVGAAIQEYSDTVAAGDVISQDPTAGTEVELGTAVSYVESLGVEQVEVPDLTGAAADATDAITAAGLTVGEATQEYSDTVAAGDVISQDPTAGTEVELGTAVSYVESLGVEQVAVPEVRDLSQEDATAAIQGADLTVGDVLERNNDSVPAGSALRTDPAAGEMADKGSAIALFMSIGPEQVEVPDIVGMAEADAIDAIEAADLVAGATSEDFSDTVPAGSVTSNTPAAGTTVDAASAVDYVLSLGIEQVMVPDVVDLAEADATAAIEAASLGAGTVTTAFDETIAAGNVVSADPAPGSEVDKGTAVDLVISDGPTPFVEVPAVRDLSEADAVAAIEAAGLVVGEIATQTHEKVATGNAIKTAPAAGEEILHGDPVKLFVSTGTQFRTIPDVAGQPAADAQAALEAEDLTVTIDERTNAKFPAGQAVKTEPAAGTENEIGDGVTLIVSKGPKQVDIPDVVGMTLLDAETAIDDAELKVGAEAVVEDSASKNTVVAQDPAPGGQADKNSTVDITVSSGPPQVVVPEVRDVPSAEAQASLEAEGLVVANREVFHAKVTAGDAVKTDPTAGTPVDVGSDVVLTTSRGPKPIVVPEVVGQKKGAATTAITEAGLVVGEETSVEDATDNNTVIAQDPPTGTEVPAGSAVNLTVSSGPPVAEIPDVRDVPAAEAQSTLEGLGLAVETKEVFHANVAAGNAIKTTPAAGESVDVGSTVTMNISKGPKPIVVPEVVGQKKGAASTAITDAGLVVGEETSVEDAAAKNTVLGQDPAAGSEVPTGTAVNLTISTGPPIAVIPEVKNVPAAEAQSTLEGLGLAVETKEVHHANVAAGDAIRTTPAAGEAVDIGSTVTINISKGPKPAVVPDVVGSLRGKAEAAITDADLTVGTVDVAESNEPQGTILGQDPAGGTEVPTGTAVNLTASAGPPTTTIPEVKNVPAAEAQSTLEGLGLVVETQQRSNPNLTVGNAVKTEPAAGETVDVGSTVLLTISKGPKLAAVPNIVGSLRGKAEAAVTDANLAVGTVDVAESNEPQGTVLSQDPAAGTEIPQGDSVNFTISAGPPEVQIPEVKNSTEARAVNDLENLGLVVETQQRSNSNVAVGNAVKTDPAVGEMVDVGSTVMLTISKGPKQIEVPSIVGLGQGKAQAAITDADLTVGNITSAEDAAAAGTVIAQNPAAGATVDIDSAVDYTFSTGPAIEQMGLGGDLASSEVMSQLDSIAARVESIRGLEMANTPYDGSNSRQHELALAERVNILRDSGAIKAEERALKRLGLLDGGADLAALLETLYGQPLPVAYFEDEGHLSVLEPNDKLDAAQRSQAAREIDRALIDQNFGLRNSRVGDKTRGDQALAGYALEQGDGTAVMVEWADSYGSPAQSNQVTVPGDEAIYASMPPILQREYSFPFLEGRIFVDRLREGGGWASINDVWNRPPESTEQILHPALYPNERPTTIVMDGIAGRLGNGWSESWQQTMGELRTGVWLAAGAAGEQTGPKAAVKLPKANAAAGWGGDRLVSLDGPDGQWAIVWQTKWDSAQDVEQFVNAANAVTGLGGSGVVITDDVSSGVSNPALVLIASDDTTLANVATSLGVAFASPA